MLINEIIEIIENADVTESLQRLYEDEINEGLQDIVPGSEHLDELSEIIRQMEQNG